MSLFHASTYFEHMCSSSGGQNCAIQLLVSRCDDTRGCIAQVWLPDDKHMCSKHVEAWNKLIIKFSASSCLILRWIYWDARPAKYQQRKIVINIKRGAELRHGGEVMAQMATDLFQILGFSISNRSLPTWYSGRDILILLRTPFIALG